MKEFTPNSVLQLIAIKTKTCVYISADLSNKSWVNYPNISDLLFDGKQPLSTFKSQWFEIAKLPTKIEKVIPPQMINRRWVLNQEITPTNVLPAIIEYKKYGEDEYTTFFFPPNISPFQSLYECQYDTTEETLEDVPFELNIIEELDQFKIVDQKFELQYNLLDQLNTHPVLLTTKPCKLSSAESFKIIRQYLQENIDRKVARLSSDYEFCLVVQKMIPLAVPEVYEVDVNLDFFSKRPKKPKFEVRYRHNRDVQVFETAPDRGGREGVYKGYTRTKEFEGKNYEDLRNNIKVYLEELIDMINKELVECECCGGRGVIEKLN